MKQWVLVAVIGLMACAHDGQTSGARTAPKREPESEPVLVTGSLILGNARVTLPEGVTAEVRSVIDFQMVGFAKEGRGFLTAYAGNWPSFPSEECREAERKPVDQGPFVAFEAQCAAGSALAREVLVQLDGAFPGFLHFMQSDAHRDLGDAIIGSLTRVPPDT